LVFAVQLVCNQGNHSVVKTANQFYSETTLDKNTELSSINNLCSAVWLCNFYIVWQ